MPQDQIAAASDTITSLLNLLKPDFTKIDKAKMISGIGLCLDAMKTTTTWPGDFDDTLWDMLKGAVTTYISTIGTTPAPAPTPAKIVVGASPGSHPGFEKAPTDSDVDAYLNHLGVGTGPAMEDVRQKLRNKPATLALLQANFTEDEQRKVVGNPFLIGLLTILGPIILNLIKAWLAKQTK